MYQYSHQNERYESVHGAEPPTLGFLFFARICVYATLFLTKIYCSSKYIDRRSFQFGLNNYLSPEVLLKKYAQHQTQSASETLEEAGGP